ncbi:MAG: cytochrome c [Gammaproteobacteria bacterium]|nr:cytochrome c [Gammaproteobacteria bacterium]
MMLKTMFSLLLLFFSAIAMGADYIQGEQLHMKSCTGCHDSALYTRDNRRVQSLPKLQSQVRFCKDNLGITWFDDEVDSVTLYLNNEFYKF